MTRAVLVAFVARMFADTFRGFLFALGAILAGKALGVL